MSIWFTSDTHFNHENIIRYSQRPFADLDEMHEVLIHNWNERVTRGDMVYHLGDFALTWKKQADKEMVEGLLKRLNGCKHLICGNHDRDAVKKANGWANVSDYESKTIHGQRIVMFHYAIRSWHGMHRGAWHLFGHSHGSLVGAVGKCMDVGVDCRGYRPIEFAEVQAAMEQRETVAVDHHRADA